ncbi:MAG: CopG family transcriptional regulator [Candidatus Omnitrophica bacterium]|nr:CopG family transcriptional regulator [Candidatus Omnitrophota bacterium]
MRNIVAISLPQALLNKLQSEAKQEHTSRSEIIRQALNEHFFTRELSKIREKASTEMIRKGKVYTEEQIFNEIS